MTRVSENSSTAAVNYSVNRARTKLEDLQLKGASLKSITRPSDNPISNVEALTIGSVQVDQEQYMRNIGYSQLQLNTTEKSLDQISEILMKAKEIAIAQSSDIYDADIRKNVANEINQLRNQIVAISNTRIGNRYLFSGQATLTRPFDEKGEYHGNTGKMHLEISKDFFVPINLSGIDVFYEDENSSNRVEHPLEDFQEVQGADRKNSIQKNLQTRTIAQETNSNEEIQDASKPFVKRNNIFSQLTALTTALENNSPETIQDLLTGLDQSLNRIITLRTRVGSILNSISNAEVNLESDKVNQADRKSKLVDADITELFSDLNKQQYVLKTAYMAGKNVMNQRLIDFLR